MVREAPWFPPDGVHDEKTFVLNPPPSVFEHVQLDSIGRVWAYSFVPDSTWQPGPPDGSAAGRRRTYDTMIEVIDVANRRVITRSRYDNRLSSVCGSSLLYEVVETDLGDIRIRILEAVLHEAG
jgi:hypothetical protein